MLTHGVPLFMSLGGRDGRDFALEGAVIGYSGEGYTGCFIPDASRLSNGY
jgi:hypothetical protein